MTTPVPPIAEDAILVHAGFHKTGTTALQSAFAAVRPALLAEGVLYPGDQGSHHRAAMALTGRTWGWGSRGGRPPQPKQWNRVRKQAVAYPGRVVISSEALSLADDAVVDRMVTELGRDRAHMVVTLRPFAMLLSSSYQQYLKYGLAMPYEKWLRKVFEAPPACPPSPNFWKRNDHAGVMARWAERIGPERVTMVMLDSADRGFLYRTFESMLALPEGLLVPDESLIASNRSMTAAESELLRLLNASGTRKWSWPDYQDRIRRGAVMRMVEMRVPGRDEPKLATPQWAVEAAQEVARGTVERVRAMGVQVIGDLDRLADPVRSGDPNVSALLPPEAAAEAVLGAILAMDPVSEYGARPGGTPSPAELAASKRVLDELSVRQAATALSKRAARAGRARARQVSGKAPGRSSS